MRDEKDNDVVTQTLTAAASYMKHDGFKPEKEFRLLIFPDDLSKINFRESGDRLVPYVSFLSNSASLPITQILIGPGWQLSSMSADDFILHHVVQGISRLLEARGLLSVSIESSRIPYDPR